MKIYWCITPLECFLTLMDSKTYCFPTRPQSRWMKRQQLETAYDCRRLTVANVDDDDDVVNDINCSTWTVGKFSTGSMTLSCTKITPCLLSYWSAKIVIRITLDCDLQQINGAWRRQMGTDFTWTDSNWSIFPLLKNIQSYEPFK